MSRILLASPYFAPKIGGVEQYAHRLTAGLAGRGHDVRVLTTSPAGQPPVPTPDGLDVVALPARWRVSATPLDPSWLRAVRGVMRHYRPDVLITHAPVPGLADVCLAVRGRVPAIATYHSGSMRKGRSLVDGPIAAYEATLLPHLLRRAEAVVTTYPGGAPGGVRGRYVPPGVDTDVFRPDPAGRSASVEEGVVLYAGRIEHASAWKGIGTLLGAFRLVADRHPTARLELAGGGDAVGHYQSVAADLGISARVRFLGPLAAADLAGAYRRASVAVLPSETDAEAFGMVLIEALACGTPVVASRAGGMPAVVADTGGGVLAEPGDSRSLAFAISRLLGDDAERERLAAAGLERVRQQYRWERVTDAFEGIIHELIEEGDLVAAS